LFYSFEGIPGPFFETNFCPFVEIFSISHLPFLFLKLLFLVISQKLLPKLHLKMSLTISDLVVWILRLCCPRKIAVRFVPLLPNFTTDFVFSPWLYDISNSEEELLLLFPIVKCIKSYAQILNTSIIFNLSDSCYSDIIHL